MIAALTLSAWDWAFLAWFLLVTAGVGFWYARRGTSSVADYFVSGRSLPWWALGTSMVATTFAADTPLAVTELIMGGGIAGNWVWWCFIAGSALTVFLFSRWWRRSEVFTEVELLALRYDGGAARALRGFKALYLGLLLNSIVIGWVTVAMGQIIQVVFDVDRHVALIGLTAVAVLYTSVSGLWGVVASDVLQFAMAMVGAILMAALCVDQVGGLGELVTKVQAFEAKANRDVLSFFPSAWDAATASVLILALVNWWAVYYPGVEPGGGGYVAQRMLAAKDERHARAGTLWFVLAHYAVRPWPWILVALCALVSLPDAVALQGKAYPAMFSVLPVGLLGLVIASFFAAFLSTITTQLNLASSYVVNDFWVPFVAKGDRDARANLRVAQVVVVLAAAIGTAIAFQLEGAAHGWQAIMELTAGTGLVLVARWLWWRVNAWSEITAILASAGMFLLLRTDLGTGWLTALAGDDESPMFDRWRLLLTVGGSTAAWLAATFATRPTGAAHLAAFFGRVRPAGAWGPVSAATGVAPSRLGPDLAMWLCAIALVFGALFGIGSLLLLRTGQGLLLLGLAAGAGLALRRMMRR